MSIKLYPPKIHLFAYSSNIKSDDSNNKGSDWLWDKCNNIISHNLGDKSFKIQDHIKKDEDVKLFLENLIIESSYSIELPQKSTIQSNKIIRNYYLYKFYPLNLKNSHRIAKVNALRIADAYALGISIYPISELADEKLTIKELIKINFNKNNCLLLKEEGNNPFLGQNILITANLQHKYRHKSSEWLKKHIADRYINVFFNDSYKQVVFKKYDRLFNTPVFEYSIYKYPDENHYIYIQLLTDDRKDIEKGAFYRAYYHFLELFLYRSKVIDAYKKIKIFSLKAKYENINIEKQIDEIFNNAFNQNEIYKSKIEALNKQLIELTQNSLEYVNILDSIEDLRNILIENTEKYKDKIEEINSYYPNQKFNVLREFATRICIKYLNEVEKQLNIFEYIFKILDIRTNGIKNLIKQIKTKHESIEKENDRNQNIAIFAAASGLATAEIANSNFAEMVQKDFPASNTSYYQMFFNENFIMRFTYSFLFGCFVAICLWVVWRIQKPFYRRYGSEVHSTLNTLSKRLKTLLYTKI